MPRVTAEMAHQLAVEQKMCVRPILRRVIDQADGAETKVAIPCGSTRETVCPSCADKARRLRIQQCAEGWHRAEEPVVDQAGREDADQLDEARYDYRRAALDALHFPKLVDRFWQNLRRCAGYKVQYFAAVEPQKRLAPHLHAAIRGAIPRTIIRQVAKASYVQVWWPAFDRPVYVHRAPEWDGADYVDPDTGVVLPTWNQSVDQAADDDHAAHVMRFGTQLDMAGIIAPSEDADRAVRYLTKYLAKSIATTYTNPDETDSNTSSTSTDCMQSCGSCRAHRSAGTGFGTVSSPRIPVLV